MIISYLPFIFKEEELENHLKETYSDPKRREKLSIIRGQNRPTRPGVLFDGSDIKAREVEEFVRKARSKSSPGNDGVSYKIYKKCPRLRKILFFLLRKMWKKEDVAERWEMAEGIYLPKEENSEKLGQYTTMESVG